MPGVSSDAARLIDGSLIAPTARPLLHSIDQLDFAPGAAWQDAEFQAELRAHHERLGASASSLSSLDALAGGAACVVTGQQPGLLLGPLLTLYKILGAVALAEALSRASGRPVVPVYWCGSDDSDFDEVRAAWAWDPTGGAFRSEVEREAWTPGQRVGDVDTVSLPDLETATLERAGADPSLLDRARSLDGISGWGDRASAWALRLFAERGLVVVDARSRRLRSLGAPWFESYARRHAEITDALSVWSVARENDGWGAPIDGVARQSGLFTVEGQVRRKLTVDELRQGRFDPENVAPSVLLRPLWQDALLGPEVAVLGPSELRYHGQLRPLYQALDVRAALSRSDAPARSRGRPDDLVGARCVTAARRWGRGAVRDATTCTSRGLATGLGGRAARHRRAGGYVARCDGRWRGTARDRPSSRAPGPCLRACDREDRGSSGAGTLSAPAGAVVQPAGASSGAGFRCDTVVELVGRCRIGRSRRSGGGLCGFLRPSSGAGVGPGT